MAEFSGPQWCSRYPGSQSVADLTPDFRDVVRAFISQMQDGGATFGVIKLHSDPDRKSVV